MYSSKVKKKYEKLSEIGSYILFIVETIKK
jgi:hypothetical protein